MTMAINKSFSFNSYNFEVLHPSKIVFDNDFYKTVYEILFEKIINGKCEPHIDCDELTPSFIGVDLYQLGLDEGVKLEKPSNAVLQIGQEEKSKTHLQITRR